jgi:hypothetical protein
VRGTDAASKRMRANLLNEPEQQAVKFLVFSATRLPEKERVHRQRQILLQVRYNEINLILADYQTEYVAQPWIEQAVGVTWDVLLVDTALGRHRHLLVRQG